MAQDTWRNWAGTETANPLRFAAPRSVEELSALVCGAAERGTRVKAVGSGHSFTGVAVTDGILVSLDALTGIESVTLDEPAGALVTVLAGTRLHDLSEQLWHRGLAMINLGDIDVQSIAGALSTGTHGTGARFGGLATQVRALQVVLADGSVADCSPTENPELFIAEERPGCRAAAVTEIGKIRDAANPTSAKPSSAVQTFGATQITVSPNRPETPQHRARKTGPRRSISRSPVSRVPAMIAAKMPNPAPVSAACAPCSVRR